MSRYRTEKAKLHYRICLWSTVDRFLRSYTMLAAPDAGSAAGQAQAKLRFIRITDCRRGDWDRWSLWTRANTYPARDQVAWGTHDAIHWTVSDGLPLESMDG